MAVIYLPPDPRWSDVGKGLGSILGNVVAQSYQNKVSAGVGEIAADPQFANNPSAMLAEVSKRFGSLGVQSLTNQLANSARVAQLGYLGAETEASKAKTLQTQFQTELQAELKPETLAKAKADVAAEEARTRLTGAQTQSAEQLLAAGMPTAQAQVEYAKGTLETAEAVKSTEETNLLKQQLDAWRQLSSPIDPANPQSPTGLDKLIANGGITDPQLAARVKNAAILNPRNPGSAAQAEIAKINAEQARLNRPELLPSDMRKTLDNSSAMLSTLTPFLHESVGEGLTGGFKAWLAKKGFDADPALVQAATAGEQNMAHFAESGTGFGGAWRVKLGQDVTPQVAHTPVYNVLVAGQIARSRLDELQNTRRQIENVPSYKGQLAAVDKQIADYKGLLDQASSLWWAYDHQDGKGNGSGKLHYYYQGQEVDSNTLKPYPKAQSTLVDPGKTYTLTKGGTAAGADINAAARQLGLTPTQLISQGQ